jgi:hypothetical protein
LKEKAAGRSWRHQAMPSWLSPIAFAGELWQAVMDCDGRCHRNPMRCT